MTGEDVARAASKVSASSDKLTDIRAQVARARDLQLEIENYDDLIKQTKEELRRVLRDELPEMFSSAGVTTIEIGPEGNHPGFRAELKPYIHANVPADNAEEAYAWLEANGHGDIIKHTVTASFGLGEEERAKSLMLLLDTTEVAYEVKKGVPWNTLTAFIKEQTKAGDTTIPLGLLGADVGMVVNLKERTNVK
jgi:hypothetical protein